MTDAVYGDHAATSPLRPEAREAMLTAIDVFGNPSSVHACGRKARKLIEKARADLLDCCGIPGGSLVFTSGATEANQTILHAFQEKAAVCSAEHLSLLSIPELSYLPVDQHGIVDLEILEALLKKGAINIVSVHHVNNETGIVQPIEEIAALTAAHGVLFHTDAVQSFSRLDFPRFADLVTISAHKIGGPKGTGALVSPRGFEVSPLIQGGGQERSLRSGTENTIGIAGFAAAVRAVEPEEYRRQTSLRHMFEEGLEAQFGARLNVVGKNTERSPHITGFAIQGISASLLTIKCDLAGLQISTGSACSSGKTAKSHVLAAMGLSADLQEETVRFSLGWNTDETQIEQALNVLRQQV